MTKVTFHSDPITGAICAHDSVSPFRLFWLGPGATHAYVGGCMLESGRYYSTADGLGTITSAATFKRAASELFNS